MYYFETIAACDLKLIYLMKICEYQRSRSFLDLGPMSFIDEDLTCFSQKPLAHFNGALLTAYLFCLPLKLPHEKERTDPGTSLDRVDSELVKRLIITMILWRKRE